MADVVDDLECPLPASALDVVRNAKGRLVCFLGSGVSLYKPTSLPTWWGYILAVIRALGDACATSGGSIVAEKIVEQLQEGVLAPYQVTDILARRLGSCYLKIMPSFLDVPTNTVHKWAANALMHGQLQAVATTNFDQAVETAVLEQGGDLVRLCGDWEADRSALSDQWERVSERQKTALTTLKKPIVVLPTFAACRSMANMTTLLGKDTHAFIVKVHGDAGEPLSCIDTELQRSQGLPAELSGVLTSLLHQFPFLFVGFGGGDLDKDIDYLRLRSDGDQATVHWLLREDEREPGGLFARLRLALQDRFSVLRGNIAGEIDSKGGEVILNRIALWARESVGELWCTVVLSELARAAKVNKSVIHDFIRDTSGFDCDNADDLVSAAAAAKSPSVGPSALKQLDIAHPCRAALCALRTGNFMQALYHSTLAVKAQRYHFADSRLFPDAWLPSVLMGASLLECSKVEDAKRFFLAARSIAEMCGNVPAMKLLDGFAVLEVHSLTAASSNSPRMDDGTTEGVIFMPFFDNVNNMALQGTPIPTLLRAQLHRAFLTGEALALPPNFLLNCRPFVAEVLCSGGAVNEFYLSLIRPLLPYKQTVDRGALGKVEVDLHAAEHPLLTFREICQLQQANFLSERVDIELIKLIDNFYQNDRRKYIIWYDLPSVVSKYGMRTKTALQQEDMLLSVFPHHDRGLLKPVLPSTLQFVRACTEAPKCALNRSLMYRWGDLFRYPITEAQFVESARSQLAWMPDVEAERRVLVDRQSIAARPWVYAGMLRDIADAAYITACPLQIGLSMIADPREVRLLKIVAAASNDDIDAKVLDPIEITGDEKAEFRIIELARLSPSQILHCRRSAAFRAFVHAVLRLRRHAATETSRRNSRTGTPAASEHAAVASHSRQGYDPTTDARMEKALVHTKSAPAEGSMKEGKLLRLADALAADEMHDKLRQMRGDALASALSLYQFVHDYVHPVDQEPLPCLQLNEIPWDPRSPAACQGGNETDLKGLYEVALNLHTGTPPSVCVCKGDPIPPTFAPATVEFPALVPLSSTACQLSTDGHHPLFLSGLMDAAPIQLLEEVVEYSSLENKWLQLRFDRVRFPGGSVGRHNIVVEFPGRLPVGVCVLSVTTDFRILFLRQYRYPVGSWSWEVPRGGLAEGMAPFEQALTELEEETGYTVDPAVQDGRLIPLGAAAPGKPFDTAGFWPNTGISSTEVFYFAAINAVKLDSGSRPDITEVIENVQLFPAQQVYDMVKTGVVRCQFTLTAIALGIVHGLLPVPTDKTAP